jgi:hypothetical protein
MTIDNGHSFRMISETTMKTEALVIERKYGVVDRASSPPWIPPYRTKLPEEEKAATAVCGGYLSTIDSERRDSKQTPFAGIA